MDEADKGSKDASGQRPQGLGQQREEIITWRLCLGITKTHSNPQRASGITGLSSKRAAEKSQDEIETMHEVGLKMKDERRMINDKR